MRIFTLGLAATAALFLMAGGAYAQNKPTPSKAQGAGADCSRTTDSGARDECVRQAQQKGGKDAKAAKDDKTKAVKAKDTKDVKGASAKGKDVEKVKK